MDIYNESMELLEDPDLSAGWLEESTRTVHHEAVDGVPEKWHYETVKEFKGGGKEVRRVIDVPGVTAREAWDEETQVLIYHPYTQAELDAMEEAKNKPTTEQRLSELEEALELILSGVTE